MTVKILIDEAEMLAQKYPKVWLVEKLIKSGAPIKWSRRFTGIESGDLVGEDVEFTGTIFKTPQANGTTLYHWRASHWSKSAN